MTTCAITLVKDFRDAKFRLSTVLSPTERHELAAQLAKRALHAASVVDECIAVVGSQEAAAVANQCGVEAIVEEVSRGQNPAAAFGIEVAIKRGADAVLILSSDLPLVDGDAIRALIEPALGKDPVAVAAVADGRGGTNALFMRPPNALPLCFGDDSLKRFREAAQERGVEFITKHDPRISLDLDEPPDLAALSRLQAAV